jgi:hypothetical protein
VIGAIARIDRPPVMVVAHRARQMQNVGVPRFLRILLIAVTLFAVSGIGPAAAALGDECGTECSDDPGCDSEPDCDGHGEGCPPLCTSCVCGTWVQAIALDPAMSSIAAIAVRLARATCTFSVPDAPLRDVFHPPRVTA